MQCMTVESVNNNGYHLPHCHYADWLPGVSRQGAFASGQPGDHHRILRPATDSIRVLSDLHGGYNFIGPNLGKHGYKSQPGEKNGIAYTCRGGDIDVIHVRIAADWTAYLATKAYKTLMNGKPGFSYKLAVDRSHNDGDVHLSAGLECGCHAEQAAAAREVAMASGRTCASP